MKLVFGFLLSYFLITGVPWFTDLEIAKSEAALSQKFILLNFSGSDWCRPCIMMRTKIFESEAFEKYASSNLVLVNADFPRLGKNQLPLEVSKKNNALLEKFNPSGRLPFTVIMNTAGKVLKTYQGLPNLSAQQFILDVQSVTSNYK